ncbi:MAG: hypothetical protein QNK23_17090 [Crocinitomicaceae bacterium]|nr:hypothetical protein [Crocinitomicaceae bacterium]
MDTKKLNTIMTIVKFALVAFGVIACILIIGGPNMNDTALEREVFRDGPAMGFASTYTGFVIIATTVAVLLFFVIQLITNTKKTALSIAGVLAALVVYLVILMIGTSDTNSSLELKESVQVAQSTINSASAGLYTALVGVVVGALAWIFSPLMGRYRK